MSAPTMPSEIPCVHFLDEREVACLGKVDVAGREMAGRET